MKRLLVILGCLMLLGCTEEPNITITEKENKTGSGQLITSAEVIKYAFQLTIDGKVVMQLTEEELLKMSVEQWQCIAVLGICRGMGRDTTKEMAKRMFPEYFKEKGGETLR